MAEKKDNWSSEVSSRRQYEEQTSNLRHAGLPAIRVLRPQARNQGPTMAGSAKGRCHSRHWLWWYGLVSSTSSVSANAIITDGVLDIQIGQILAHGNGSLHGIDGSPAMIEASKKAVTEAELDKTCTFQGRYFTYQLLNMALTTPVLDANTLLSTPSLQTAHFSKVFSNAAMHWILRPPATREAFFHGVKDALIPGGRFVFEMGGLGNVAEVRAALLSAVGRRIGLARAQEVDPWFFPDEEWVREMLEQTVGGFEVEKIEREWRPTDADVGGVEGWIRLMGKEFFRALGEDEREVCIREVVDVLEVVCRKPGGGFMLSYVRLRAVARKL